LCNMRQVAMSRSRTIHGPATLNGSIIVPGDKSISHRAAILASLAVGVTAIEGFSSADDCLSTLDCIRVLGIPVERLGTSIKISGRGLDGYRPSEVPLRLDAGNSGSTIRMLAGVLAAQRFTSVIDGDQSLRSRPMARIIEPLTRMGAIIHSRERSRPPLTIHGHRLSPITYTSPVASAQVKSCILLAGLFGEGTTSVTEPAQSRNHTELMLPEFGANVRICGLTTEVDGPAALRSTSYNVPGDVSSAAFFAAAGAMQPDSDLTIRGVNLNPTRTGFLDVLESLGARIERTRVREQHGELVGDLQIRGGGLRAPKGGTLIGGSLIPGLIDELPILAVVATRTEGRIEVRDARELRVKESDRIAAITRCLRSLGGRVEELEDGFAIEGPQQLRGAPVESCGDHRIAMAACIAGLAADGTTTISDGDCASVSFPEFYNVVKSVVSGGAVE